MENREEIFDRPEAASAEGAAPVESQPRQSEETSRKAMEGLRLSQGVGSYANNMQYGGDAYTGIQNAAAQTARNVKALATIAKDGFGFLLMAVGLIAVFYFALRLSDKRKNG